MDSPHQVAEGYGSEIIWDGLGLVDFSIVPHYRSDHPEAPAAELAAQYFTESRIPFRTLRDGDVLIQDGTELTLCPRATTSLSDPSKNG